MPAVAGPLVRGTALSLGFRDGRHIATSRTDPSLSHGLTAARGFNFASRHIHVPECRYAPARA
ncbi:hypothetical protein Athai_55230 [Actinocatenispora thailandica]|uniref:Uncharacterized protein n=1 Tax=Actinocatenispora thailandica TaxID=227318 RepID=A0A7R7DUG8_9ACTN|nr:hypothetical protein Athai_55230 [Actinocatenispora thailandica]